MSTSRAEVEGLSDLLTLEMNSSSSPWSIRRPAMAPNPRPARTPNSGPPRMRPTTRPQKPPRRAPLPVVMSLVCRSLMRPSSVLKAITASLISTPACLAFYSISFSAAIARYGSATAIATPCPRSAPCWYTPVRAASWKIRATDLFVSLAVHLLESGTDQTSSATASAESPSSVYARKKR
jgi:hypothetical protein